MNNVRTIKYPPWKKIKLDLCSHLSQNKFCVIKVLNVKADYKTFKRKQGNNYDRTVENKYK